MSETLPRVPKRRSRAALITLALLAGIALTLWYGWKKPVEHLATQAIREALPRDVEVAKVEVNSPTSISLVGVERGPVAAEEIKVTFSAMSALKDGVASGVERVEIVRPTIRIEPAKSGERLSPAEWIERVREEVQALVAAETRGLGGPSLGGAPVVVTDGRLLVGDDEVATGVRALLTPGPAGVSAQLNTGFLHIGGVPWALRGEYRPVAEQGRSVHALRLSGTRGGASVSLAGEFGGESEFAVEMQGVEAVEIGRLLLALDDASPLIEPLAALGRAEGSLVLRGSFDRPEVLGRLAGRGEELGTEESAPWRLEVSGGGTAPIDAVFAVDGEAIKVAYAPVDGGGLRLSGAGLPVALVGRFAGLLLGVDVPFRELRGSADIDILIDRLGEGSPEGSFEARLSEIAYGAISADEGRLTGTLTASEDGGRFEVSGTLLGETSGEFSGSGKWSEGRISGALDVPWAYFRSFSIADGAFQFESGPGGVVLFGSAKSGGGSIELRDGIAGAQGFRGAIALSQGSAPGVVELLRAFNVTFPGDRTMRGQLSGVVEIAAAPEGGVSVSGRLESDRLGYRDLSFEDSSLAGRWSAGRWEIASLVLRQGEAELLLSARGEGDRVEGEGVYTDGPFASRARIEFAGGGRWSEELRLVGRGFAGEGDLALDASWRPADAEYGIDLDLDRFPLALIAGGAIDGAMLDAAVATGPLSLAGGGGAWRAKADLSFGPVAYGDAELQGSRFELDLGSLPGSEALPAAPGCEGCLYGTGRLHGELALAGEGAAQPFDVRVDFSGERGVVSALPLDARGGRITGGGTLELAKGEWGFDLRSDGRRLAYEDGGIEALLDFALRLSGRASAPSLAGKVTVSQGKFDLLRLPTAPSRGNARRTGRGLGFDPALDVEIEVKPAQVTAGTLLAGEMEGAIGVKGSARSPELFGEVALVRGDFRYLGSRFEATGGNVRFRGGAFPTLEMAGKRRVGGVEITAAVAGPADDLRLTLTSEPPLSQAEILELLNVPSSVDLSEGWGELARSLANLVNAELASQVYWRIGQAVEDALDLDRFRIDDSDGALRLTIGKYVNPDLYLSYSRTLDGAASQDIAAEYRLSPNMTLTSEWDFDEKRDLGIKVTVPF